MRKKILAGALAAIVALAFLDPGGNETHLSAPSGSEPSPQQAPTSAQPASAGLKLPERRDFGRARGELFASPPPPPPAPVASAPSAPMAPPMPYRFAGRFRQGEEDQVLVSRGDSVFPVKEGDTIEGGYKVLAIGADRIELVYLPLGTKERIAVHSTLEVESPPQASLLKPAPVAPGGSTASVETGKPARLRWEGPGELRAGASFSVALKLSSDELLRAAPMQLRFEPGVLEPVNVRPGKFFGQGNFSYRVNPEGSIFVGATAPGAAPGADAELLVLTFKPIKAGVTAELGMTSLSLQGAAGRALAHSQIAAYRAPIIP